MKIIILAVCLFGVLAHGHPRHPFRTSMDKCLENNDIKREDYQQLMAAGDSKAICIKACSMQEEQVMDANGEFNDEKLMEKFEPILNEFDQEAASGAFNTCLLEAKTFGDSCERANKFSRCMWRSLRKLRQEKVIPTTESERGVEGENAEKTDG